MRAKRSVIWKISAEEFKEIIDSSNSIGDVLINLGLANKGGNYLTVKNRAIAENIDLTDLYERQKEYRISKLNLRSKTDIDAVLKGFSNVSSTHHFKTRLIKEKYFEDKCDKCGLSKTWNGEPITLQLHHIDGNNKNNIRDNLNLLCPNCHSQTKNFAGRNRQYSINDKGQRYCEECGKPIIGYSFRCHACSFKTRRKVDRPPRKELIKLIKENGYEAVGRMYGVSGNAIRRWLK